MRFRTVAIVLGCRAPPAGRAATTSDTLEGPRSQRTERTDASRPPTTSRLRFMRGRAYYKSSDSATGRPARGIGSRRSGAVGRALASARDEGARALRAQLDL